jgi:transaldolase
VLYVNELIGPVNTMPEKTLRAFGDHGEVARTLNSDPAAGQATLARIHEAGIDLDAQTAALEREGVESFCASYRELLDCLQAKLAALASAGSTVRG